jgi:hypothetical protein
MKRQRGRGRKPGGGHHHQPNRALESSGPEVKVRGPAAHIYERYLQLARDATSAGDRVMAENYMQHAEHYFRVLRAMQPASPPPQNTERFAQDSDTDDDSSSDSESGDSDGGGDGGELPDVDAQFTSQAPEGQRGDGEFRRRRGRRSRFKPGERGPNQDGPREASGEGGDNGPKRAREEGGGERPREDKRARDDKRPEEGEEGFSSGPTPAFLAPE